jgi:hypothetical protein
MPRLPCLGRELTFSETAQSITPVELTPPLGLDDGWILNQMESISRPHVAPLDSGALFGFGRTLFESFQTFDVAIALALFGGLFN